MSNSIMCCSVSLKDGMVVVILKGITLHPIQYSVNLLLHTHSTFIIYSYIIYVDHY